MSLRASAKSEYPKRPQYFANKFCRLLTKSAAAQDLGPEACWLLTVIANQEDAKRYRSPVTFYNQQLMPLCGFSSEGRLIRTRSRAVDGGWLHYASGGKGKPGIYWCLVPDGCESLSDSSIDEDEDSEDFHFQNTSASASESEGKAKGNRSANGCLTNLYPFPTPSPKRARSKVNDAEIEKIYEAYPRHVGKAAALKAIRKAVDKIDSDGLLAAVRDFAAATRGTETRFIPHCATWMNQERWTDDRSEWREQSGQRQPGPGVKHDPSAADNGRPVATEGFF